MQKLLQWQSPGTPDWTPITFICLLKSGFSGTIDLTETDLLVYYLDRCRYLYSLSKKHKEFLYLTNQWNAVWV